ncbi:MAG: HAD-IC family P-type ATPase, partial [Nitriliruptoraceae bacterium]
PREARSRLEVHGANELERERRQTAWQALLAQFTSPLISILVVAFVVTFLIAEYTDAAVIAAVLAINATIGFVQERRAEQSVDALMALAAPRSMVLRDGHLVEVDAAELVPGDVVELASGTRVPADLRLVRTTTLDIDESLLTGESATVRKSTDPVAADLLAVDRVNLAFMGTVVSSGRGTGVVVETAAGTQLGSIAQSIRAQERPTTPLQARMTRFAHVVAVAVLGSTAVAFVAGVALGAPAEEMFLTAVALAVAVVPEGLPVALTVALALGVRRMASRRAIIRSLPAVETLGSTDVIGSDKTGTLTANRMTVVAVWTPCAGHLAVGDVDVVDLSGPEPTAVVRTVVLSNEADLAHETDEDVVVEEHGDPTEVALLEFAVRTGVDVAAVRRDTAVLAEVPFESRLRLAYVVVDEDGAVLRAKGAPERILELCDAMGVDHEVVFDPDVVLAEAERMAADGLRVLATAQRRLDTEVDDVDPHAPPRARGLVLTGLVGMHDPPRRGVLESIRRCRRAGIRVVMITGDHAATARAIARELEIVDADDARVVTGVELESTDDSALEAIVAEVDVFARVAPDHKLRVVRALQAAGRVVAVTGDGVNDGPALKAADIGVAMGRSGTDVAREASDMVLTDDDFVSIAAAVEEGRVVFDNVRKVTYFLLSTGAASIVAIIASIFAGLPLPYVPAALLWLNVVTNGLQDVALAFDQGEPDVLDRPPRRRDEGVVNRVLWERTALTGVTLAAGSLWLFVWAIDAGLDAAQQRGAALTTLVVAMAFHVYNARSERRSIVATHVAGNRFLLVSSLGAVALHVGALYWQPTRDVLQVADVPAAAWLRIGVVALAVVLVSEGHKWWRSRGGVARLRDRFVRAAGRLSGR